MSSQGTPAWDAVRRRGGKTVIVSVQSTPWVPPPPAVVSVRPASPTKRHLWGVAGEVGNAEGQITGLRIVCAECGRETVASLLTESCPG